VFVDTVDGNIERYLLWTGAGEECIVIGRMYIFSGNEQNPVAATHARHFAAPLSPARFHAIDARGRTMATPEIFAAHKAKSACGIFFGTNEDPQPEMSVILQRRMK
jgi:hypothetical protein